MPLHDWQFWIVSALALGAAWILVRPFLARGKSRDGSCPTCPSGGGAKSRGMRRRVTLTVERKHL